MSATLESTLVYYIGQTELYDPSFHLPLVMTTASRDIEFKAVSIEMEATSFLRNSYGATGGQSAQGLPYMASNGNNAPGISVESEKVTTPFRLLQRNLAYSKIELMRSQRVNQPLDTSKMLALNTLYQLDRDRVVYLGDTGYATPYYGLVNNPIVNTADVALGVSGFTSWTTKTPDEILNDVNSMISDVWIASGLEFPPNTILIPPSSFSYISSQKVSDAGNISILNYLKINCISTSLTGSLNVMPLKFLSSGNGANSANNAKNRMVAYTKALDYVRFPLCPIQGWDVSILELNFIRPYTYGFGEVEFVYPETLAYRDGI